MASYFLAVLTALIAVFQLAKDWNAHSNHWRRGSVVVLIFALLGVSVYNTHASATKTVQEKTAAEQRHAEDQKQITKLQTAVDTANAAQTSNTELFLASLNGLSQKVANLQTQVKTQDLKDQARQLQKELSATRKVLEPPPKVTLAWSFFDPTIVNDENLSSIRETTAVRHGSDVHVEVSIVNRNLVELTNVEISIVVCDECTFAKLPPGFQHLEGVPPQYALRTLDRLPAKTATGAMPIDISVPAQVSRVALLMKYRCQLCAISNTDENLLFVNVKSE